MVKKWVKYLAMWGLIIISLGLLAGCGAPKGFIDDDYNWYPFNYSGDEEAKFPNLSTQFPEFEDEYIPGKHRKVFFWFFGEKHYLIRPKTGASSIYRQTDQDEKIGDFVDVKEQHKNRGVAFYWPFLYEDCLYYFFQINDSKSFGLSDWTWFDNRFVRFEYYKFDLITGENEAITLTKFVEALHAIDNSWEINPDYKGKK